MKKKKSFEKKKEKIWEEKKNTKGRKTFERKDG